MAQRNKQLSKNNQLLRIIDANINRSREGLRVVEEIVRFIIENKPMSLKAKTIRHDFDKTVRGMSIDMRDIELSRESEHDVGRALNIASEIKKCDIREILMANIHRTEESLRVLEEFLKLFDVHASAGFKKLRFDVYTLEKFIIKGLLPRNR